MSSTYRVRHTTRYEYETPVMHAHHLGHLRPRSLPYQEVHQSEFSVVPSPRAVASSTDYFGNETEVVELLDVHECLEVTMTSTLTVSERAGVLDPPVAPPWDSVVQRLDADPTLFEPQEFRFDSPLVRAHPMLAKYAQGVFLPGRPLVDALLELNRRIYSDFEYAPQATDVSTPLAEVMRRKQGVCQDFAHVAIGCLRSFGLAARYVSGYLETRPPAGMPRLVGADASHAWVAVFVPEFGWLDLDPTNDVLPSQRHVTVAWGRDFSDVSPLKGVVLGGGGHSVAVAVDVEPQN